MAERTDSARHPGQVRPPQLGVVRSIEGLPCLKAPYQCPPFGRSPSRMLDYRAYFVGREKHFIGYRGFVCEDDDEAIEKAKELFEGPTIELW